MRGSVLIAMSLVACAPAARPGAVARDVQIMQVESSPDRLFARGKAFHSVGDPTRAEQYYAAALQAGYPEAEVLPLLLRVCIDSGRFEVAIDYAEPYLRRRPHDARLRSVVAALRMALGDVAGARKEYETILETDDDPMAHYALALLLRDQFAERLEADAHFRAYLRLEPSGRHAEEARASLLRSVEP
jgi:tetratricopeptide (TPR) repeat protein